MASALVYPMKLVMSPEYRKAFPCVTRWFTTCVNQPQFKAVIGTVELAKEEMTAEGAPAAPKKEKVGLHLSVMGHECYTYFLRAHQQSLDMTSGVFCTRSRDSVGRFKLKGS